VELDAQEVAGLRVSLSRSTWPASSKSPAAIKSSPRRCLVSSALDGVSGGPTLSHRGVIKDLPLLLIIVKLVFSEREVVRPPGLDIGVSAFLDLL
jgi:hypothetical protein